MTITLAISKFAYDEKRVSEMFKGRVRLRPYRTTPCFQTFYLGHQFASSPKHGDAVAVVATFPNPTLSSDV